MKSKTHIKFYIISFLQFLMEEIVGTSLIIFLLYKDLSLKEVNFLLAFGFFIVWIGEIPTGLVADKYGRKASIIIGLILHLIYLYTFIEKQGYYILLLASIFSGLYTCFISGSLEAWVVENTDRPIEEIFSNNNIIRNVAGITAGIFGAILASKNLVYPWIFSFAISVILLIFIIFFVSDNFRYMSGDKKQTIKSISIN
ncbi:MAG: MFS transporter, partial [Peptoniphilus sp.]|uniref:MFS transporter n=1 Tax=Peptoniphilus sp. TaxID=1971214 RepID=UPI002A756EDF